MSKKCDANGKCECAKGFTGDKCNDCSIGFSGEKCETCEDGYYDFPDCKGNKKSRAHKESFHNFTSIKNVVVTLRDQLQIFARVLLVNVVAMMDTLETNVTIVLIYSTHRKENV